MLAFGEARCHGSVVLSELLVALSNLPILALLGIKAFRFAFDWLLWLDSCRNFRMIFVSWLSR